MTIKEFIKHFGFNEVTDVRNEIVRLLQETKTVTVHNGAFHEDDVKAVALALIYAERVLRIKSSDITIIRSRSNLLGLIMDVAEGFCDHHNREVFAEYEDGTRYAAAGLLFTYIGRELVPSDAEFERILAVYFKPGDAADNGDFSKIGVTPNFASTLSSASNAENRYELFMQAVGMYKTYLEAVFDTSRRKFKDEEYVNQCLEEAVYAGKKYIFFEKVCDVDYVKLSNAGIKFIAMPVDDIDSDDKFEAVSLRCEDRELFPEIINGNNVWGLRKKTLSDASGIDGMEFIHKDGFFATTATAAAMQALLDLV